MLNKVILMGRLTRDPELRHTSSNIPVASFTLAVDRSFGRGEQKETDFIDVVCWRQQADFVAKWFTKGQLVAVSGRLQVRNWEDKDGNKRRAYEVVADEVHFAESRKSTGGYDRQDSYGNQDTPAYASAAPRANAAPLPETPSDFSELLGSDDDLPF